MFCLTCGYDLSATPPGPCPECGRVFDPADTNSWGARRTWRTGRPIAWAIGIAGAGPLLVPIMIGIQYLVAWFVLGHPPQPYVDDPKYINRVCSGFHIASWLSVALAMALTPVSIGAALIAGYMRRRLPKWSLLALWALLAWPVAGVVMNLYPDSLNEWWSD